MTPRSKKLLAVETKNTSTRTPGQTCESTAQHCAQDGLPRIPPGCIGWPVPVPGVLLGPPRRTASPYPRLISCHPSGMAFGRRLDCWRPAYRASRRDAGILAGGRGRVSCGRHPRKPSFPGVTRTPAGARGRARNIQARAGGFSVPNRHPCPFRALRTMKRGSPCLARIRARAPDVAPASRRYHTATASH